MPQPPAYTRGYSFTGFSQYYPSNQQPGTQIDAEFNGVKSTLDAILANLILIQRDDGALKNSTVTMQTLASDVLTVLGGENGNWIPRGAWATQTAFAVGNVVAQGAQTYVCAIAHTSGVFANDLAAGNWVTIYSATASVVADGTITTAKVVDGNITSTKLSQTLDITGSFRAQGGLTGGTEIAGSYLIGAKAEAGNSNISIARTTRLQGFVGLLIGGGIGGTVWNLTQAPSKDDLNLYSSLSGITLSTFYNLGGVDWSGTQRITGSVLPLAGAGLELGYIAAVGTITAYDRGGSVYQPLRLAGSSVFMAAGGVDVITASSTGAAVNGALSVSGPITSGGNPIALPGAFSGLKIATIGASNYTSVITANAIALSTAAGATFIAKNVNVSPNITSVGANGIDTGSVSASTWYFVYVIYNPTTLAMAGLFSLSSTAPTLPAGFASFARVGAVRTDGSASKYFISTMQCGRRVQYVVQSTGNFIVPVTIASGAAGTYNASSYSPVAYPISSAIPPTACEVEFEIGCGTGGQVVGVSMTSGIAYAGGFGAVPPVPYNNVNNNSNSAAMVYRAFIQSGNIYYAGSGVYCYCYALGWEDNL